MTTRTASSSGSTSCPPRVSSISMTMTPAGAPKPAPGKVNLSWMSCVDPRLNSGVEARRRSRSRAWERAAAISSGEGRSQSSCSSGPWMAQEPSLLLAGGRPLPKPLDCPVKSMALNQSPEL